MGLYKELTFASGLQVLLPFGLIVFGHGLNRLDGRGGDVDTTRNPRATLQKAVVHVTEITVTWR